MVRGLSRSRSSPSACAIDGSLVASRRPGPHDGPRPLAAHHVRRHVARQLQLARFARRHQQRRVATSRTRHRVRRRCTSRSACAMIRCATSMPVARSTPRSPGELLTSMTRGPSARLEHVDAGDAEPHDARGVERGAHVGRRQLGALPVAAAMQVRAELALLGGAPHRRHQLAADDDGAQIAPARLGDELLQDDVLPQPPQGVDDRLDALRASRPS